MKNINEIADGLKDLDAPKSAKHYASTTPIPDWLEAEIAKLDNDNLALFASDLGESLYLSNWVSQTSADISEQAAEWLESQDRDTFKALLQWVAMELI